MRRLLLLLPIFLVVACAEDNRGAFGDAAWPMLRRLDAELAVYQNMDENSSEYGGIACPSCGEYHSRAAESVFPFAYEYSVTGDEQMLERSMILADWLLSRQEENGAWVETPGTWTGTTADQLLALLLAYPILEDRLSDARKTAWLAGMRGAADYLVGVMDDDFAYINYCATSACCLAEAFRLFGDEKYKDKASALAHLCTGKLNADAFLEGEGENTGDGKTGVDIGYNMDMSLWGLAAYARLLDDGKVMESVRTSARALMRFVFPDGSVDCSAGLRSCKWALWGSATADGMYPLCALLSSDNPEYLTAAVRNISVLESCIGKDGLVAPGPSYDYLRDVPPCIYPTFLKAKSLAMALTWLETDAEVLSPLPCDSDFEIEYPSLGVAIARKGAFCSSFIANDYKSQKGAESRFMHRPAGGTTGMLWADGYGTVQVASQNEYHRWEPIHFPELEGLVSTSSRIEFRSGEEYYTNIYDYDAKSGRDGDFRYMATGWLRSRDAESCGIKYGIKENFSQAGFAKRYYLVADGNAEVRVVEPIVVDENTSFHQVDAYTVRFSRGSSMLTVKSEGFPIAVDPDGEGPYRQLYPAVMAVPLVVEMPVSAEASNVIVVFSMNGGDADDGRKKGLTEISG